MSEVKLHKLGVGSTFKFADSHSEKIFIVEEQLLFKEGNEPFTKVSIGAIQYLVSGNRPIAIIEEKKMSTKVLFKKKPLVKTLKFEDLQLKDGFKIKNGKAIYQKVRASGHIAEVAPHSYFMLEVATGKFFNPTKSDVVRIEIEINVDVEKPDIY